MKKTSYGTVSPNIFQTGKTSYRCRVMKNGKRIEKYETNLKRAKRWVNSLKTS